MTDRDRNVQKAKRIIEKILYITIASVSKVGTPWNTPVFSAYDENYNFYWGSHRESQHSQNVRANNNVFLAIYDSTIPAGDGEAVYIKARVVELEELDEITAVHNLLEKRHTVPYWKLAQVHGDTPIRLYKAIPEKMWVNAEGEKDGHYIDIREEVSLVK